MQSSFPSWVPEAARRCITELRKTPLGMDDTGGALLERLATYPAMKTDVWERLPLISVGIERNIIEWTFFAITFFPRLRRPYPKTASKRRTWAKHIENNPPLPEPAYLSQLALLLYEEIFKLKLETDSYWPQFWEGDKSITSGQVLETLDQLRLFYVRMDQEYGFLLASLPKIRRWNDKSAEKFFTEYLSQRISETCGRPLDSIIAALAEVAFDLHYGVESETVRGRRRLARTPEKSK